MTLTPLCHRKKLNAWAAVEGRLSANGEQSRTNGNRKVDPITGSIRLKTRSRIRFRFFFLSSLLGFEP